MFNADVWGTVGQWVAAAATLSAALVALFKDEILRRRRRPLLNASIATHPPDSHLTTMQYAIGFSAGASTAQRAPCYYFRLWVNNEGKTRAEKVEVFLQKVERLRADGQFETVARYSPLHLKWSNSGDVFAEGISPGMGRHCDLGHILDPSHTLNIGYSLDGIEEVPREAPLFTLDVEVQPFTRAHLLAPGDYQLTIQIAGANAKPIEKRLRMAFKGTWSIDERDMLSRGIGFSIADGG